MLNTNYVLFACCCFEKRVYGEDLELILQLRAEFYSLSFLRGARVNLSLNLGPVGDARLCHRTRER